MVVVRTTLRWAEANAPNLNELEQDASRSTQRASQRTTQRGELTPEPEDEQREDELST